MNPDPNPSAGASTATRPHATRIPTILNLGSGRAFDEACLNVDVDPSRDPDIVADLDRPFPGGDGGCGTYQTARFGLVTIGTDTFDEVIARNVFPRIRELTTAMTSCLRVLRPGGLLRISVPHELGLDAWSDPRHVRAFNERSWSIYTDGAARLGWTKAQFELLKLDFTTSALGRELEEEGRLLPDILRTPRAVDAMHVVLRKVTRSAS